MQHGACTFTLLGGPGPPWPGCEGDPPAALASVHVAACACLQLLLSRLLLGGPLEWSAALLAGGPAPPAATARSPLTSDAIQQAQHAGLPARMVLGLIFIQARHASCIMHHARLQVRCTWPSAGRVLKPCLHTLYESYDMHA